MDDSKRADYEVCGSEPFMPYKDRATVMSYHEVPEEVTEDPQELLRRAQKARATALPAPQKRRKDG